jgi:hypothetical protein
MHRGRAAALGTTWIAVCWLRFASIHAFLIQHLFFREGAKKHVYWQTLTNKQQSRLYPKQLPSLCALSRDILSLITN